MPALPAYFTFPRLRSLVSPWVRVLHCPSVMALYSPPVVPTLDELPSHEAIGVISWTRSLPWHSRTRSTMASTDTFPGVAVSLETLPCTPPSLSLAVCPLPYCLLGTACVEDSPDLQWIHPCCHSPSSALSKSAADESCDPGDLSCTCALAALALLPLS